MSSNWSTLGKNLDHFFRLHKIVDAHVHVGYDIDGHKQTVEEHLRYEEFGIVCRIIFPFNEVDKTETTPWYRKGNWRIFEAVQKYTNKCVGFLRLYPPNFKNEKDLWEEIDMWCSYGLKGIKLRPGKGGDEYDISLTEPTIRLAGKKDLQS